MRRILMDMRWEGTGGIGTFAKEINRINRYETPGFSGKPYSPFDPIKTALRLIKKKNSVVFFPGFLPPLFSLEPYVFTIHDLNHLDRQDNSSFFKKAFYNFIIKRGCSKSKFIFTVSEFSKSRIVQWSGQDPSKIINVGNGVAECFTPEGEKKNFGFKYLLCVSNRKTHKNEYNTILAFKKSGLYNEYKLVFTGSPNETISDFIEHHGLTESVHFTGYLKDDELPLLYRGAAALVFVSFYEGFGLPVIEAMASGIPVVTSRTTSLGEVAGDAALLVDPENKNEIADAINQIILDNNCRQQLVNKGLMQARKFTWEEVARKVDNHLRRIK